MDRERHGQELEAILDEVSYQVTSARAAGLDRIDELRAALKRVRDLAVDADTIAGAVAAEHGDDG
jgi:hypothetical protein